jgi:hypothetical protein
MLDMAEPLRKYQPLGPEPKAVQAGSAERRMRFEGSPKGTPVQQAYRILKFGFTVALIIAGADKFFHFLVNWDQYLSPIVPNVFNLDGHKFMLEVGVAEIIAGLGVAFKPKIFGDLVSLWLICIVINLLTTGQYLDIALRDFGLALGAFALGRLSQVYD